MQKQLARPGEEIFFAGIEMSCALKFLLGGDELALLLLDLAQQVVQFAGILPL